jgi:hypothetical protein
MPKTSTPICAQHSRLDKAYASATGYPLPTAAWVHDEKPPA